MVSTWARTANTADMMDLGSKRTLCYEVSPGKRVTQAHIGGSPIPRTSFPVELATRGSTAISATGGVSWWDAPPSAGAGRVTPALPLTPGFNMRLRTLFACSTALFLATSTAQAQYSASGQNISPLPQVVSINGLLLPFGGLVAEYEAAVSPNVTLGGSLAYYDFVGGNNDRYTSGEVKARFYPNEMAPAGLSVGLTLGFGRAHDDHPAEDESASKSGLTTGIELDYNWLVGPNERFFIGSGVLVKRRFGSLKDDWIDLEVFPSARLQLGMVF